ANRAGGPERGDLRCVETGLAQDWIGVLALARGAGWNELTPCERRAVLSAGSGSRLEIEKNAARVELGVGPKLFGAQHGLDAAVVKLAELFPFCARSRTKSLGETAFQLDLVRSR